LSGKRAPYEFTMGGKKVGSTLKVRKKYPKVVSLREAQSTKRDWVVVSFLVVGCFLWALLHKLVSPGKETSIIAQERTKRIVHKPIEQYDN
jgi:hypothetical protein